VQAGDDDDDDDDDDYDDDQPQQETIDAETFFVPVAFLLPKQQCQSTVSSKQQTSVCMCRYKIQVHAYLTINAVFLQCVDAVVWLRGRASGM